jgi:hypothetical protein
VDLDALMRSQNGVISRRQVLANGGDDNLIEKRVRRRLWRVIHPGVYVDHTGVPTAEQAQQAAVLYAWPAALGGESALHAHGALDPPTTTTVAIDHTRRVREPPGVRVVRVRGLAEKVLWNRTPPRLRLESAALHVASERFLHRGEADAVALLSDVCQRRMTTPPRLLASVDACSSLPGRGFLRAVLVDVAEGAFSLLEHRYLTRVERAHRLPRGSRQRSFATEGRTGFRDVMYDDQQVVVELDGRLGHEWAADQWSDLARDLRSATEQLQTIRLGWGAVSTPCRLAVLVGQVLQARGWSGSHRPCRDC